jgi:hypothetical protein
MEETQKTFIKFGGRRRFDHGVTVSDRKRGIGRYGLQQTVNATTVNCEPVERPDPKGRSIFSQCYEFLPNSCPPDLVLGALTNG